MIAVHGGVQGDVSSQRLPADAVPALFAYSLNRKVRKLYAGNYFRYRQESGGEFDYPANTPNLTENVFLVKVYDQKAKHGVPAQDAVQLDESKQPKIDKDTLYKAVFNQREYLDIANLAPLINQDFTITSIGNGAEAPRPMIGVWGNTDRLTVEPSDDVTRFLFNKNLGTILDADGRVIQCVSGYSVIQNNQRALTLRTGDNTGHVTIAGQDPNFLQISIGRENQRLYKGDFMESTMHLEQLTSLGSDQLFQTTRQYYES
ncbi:MAG: hypothetical protein CMC82_06005 [Flavobacteriaceae bacterium]|nr:hypothetical protein [Flavobacteriaceae bacterium]|tara:strand:+ start:498 stop:1277 length:780 start_codon:yes stop_codon:yes gene_type:complete